MADLYLHVDREHSVVLIEKGYLKYIQRCAHNKNRTALSM